MNVDQLKVMLELQALQNFNKPSAQPGNSVFQDMLTSMISDRSQSLGATADQLNNFAQFNVNATSADDYLRFHNNSSRQMLPQLQFSKVSNSISDFDAIVDKAAAAFNLPAKLIKSVIQKESNFNPDAVSTAGASGLMQLMPDTARGLGVKNIFDPAENIFAGSKYLRQMMDKYGDNLELALAAYNAGPGNVDKYGGIPPFKETQNYVQKVTRTFYG
ncbi:MAG TPA: lytic transglycosylase [Bacillus bacterium]|nr:lytic transglycosylase [Bacillus sp. (in: firmicutes)]